MTQLARLFRRTILLLPSLAFAQTGYQPYFDDNFSSINSTAWYQNGPLTTGSAGLTSADANGGALISKVSVPDGTSQYEVKATLTLDSNQPSGGTFGVYLRASSDALSAPTASGTYYVAEIQNVTFSGGACSATFSFYKRVNGTITPIQSNPVPCNNGMTVRAVYSINNWIAVYLNDIQAMWIEDADIGTGQPGVGVRGAPSTNGISRVDLGPLDRIAPTATPNPITSSAFGDHIDLKWSGSVDDPNGIGIGYSLLFRTRTDIPGQSQVFVSSLQPWATGYSDYGVTATASYTYQVYVYDYHLNSSNFSFPVSIPGAGSIDPREVGVRPLGSYWGGGGEQIDMRSGNLNYTMPLIKAQGRGGWSIGFNLSYNSQNWRQDPAGVWQLGRDTGYGYGWRLQAGSLTPIFQDYFTLRYWLFIDSTGAEYKLNQWNGSVWTSLEGIYLAFDPNITGNPGSTHLYFPDGSFWELNALSAGTEQDAGTFYPTFMEDTNGNQVIITYKPGQNVSYSNSSARIATIEDVRGNGNTDYTFMYNTDTIPHRTSITNGISTPENYTLSYSQAALIQPFASVSNNNFGTFKFLQSVEVNGPNLTTSFTYIPTTDPNTNPPTNGYSGELAQMTTPYGGHLRWAYAVYTLSGSRTFREVQNRYLLMCASSMAAYCSANGGTETQIQLTRDVNGDTNRNVHYFADLIDLTANAQKVWYFQIDTTQFYGGLATIYQERTYPANVTFYEQDFTWNQTPTSVNPYIGSTVTTLDGGQSYQAQKKTTQSLDQYGNLLTMQVYDFGPPGEPPSSAPTRTYQNSYVSDSNYISRHITNRLSWSTVTDGTNTTTLVQNYYDGQPSNGYCLSFGGPSNVTGLHEHDDTNYGQTFYYRGDLHASVTPSEVRCRSYDITGNVTSTSVNGVTSSVNINSTTNWAVPSQITTYSLTSNMSWYLSLYPNSITGPNTDTTSFTFDGNGRPYQTTSATGATTTYTYADTASLPYKTATTNGHWVQTAMDGFGRTIQTLTGYGTTGVSVVATHYDPCGCSPLGKVSQVSQPFAPGAAVYWAATYTYDASGRTTKIALPDGSATTYVYQGNTVTVTDPAGKWKTFTMDAFGNLTKVVEPTPVQEASGTPSATFVRSDTGTSGNWKGNYGNEGFDVIGDTANIPAYASVQPSGYANGWGYVVTDTRALQMASSQTNRIAACWYSGTSFTIDINFTGIDTHQVAFYFLDWDGNNQRTERIDILDPNNNVLDSRSISAFGNGVYLVWNLSGHVIVKFTNTGPANAVVSGLFFDGVSGSSSSGTFTTNYSYDILNHLTRVNMPRGTTPAQPDRTFNYTSGTTVGAFLLSATNPENGTVTYRYSNNLLASKTDANGQAFTYDYDGYNRLWHIYLNGTLFRQFYYDTNPLDGTFSGPYTAGRLVAVKNAQFTPGSSNPTQFIEMYSYTIAGQPNQKRLQVNLTGLSANLDAAYSYDTEGKMKTVSYPNAGPTYRYAFDGMDRPTGLTDQTNYAAVSGVQYGGTNQPPDLLTSMSFFGVTETRQYNTLRQLTNITVPGQINMTYTFPSGTNNGKISSQYDGISHETVIYQYDALNHLISAAGNGWSQDFGYDGFGNLISKAGSNSPPLSLAVDPATNRAIIANVQYDNNGNPNAYNNIQLTYDAENHVVGAPSAYLQYAYDSQGKRVWRGTLDGNGNVTAQEVYFYGVDGQKLGTYSVTLGSQLTVMTTETAVFFGAKRVAVNGAAFVQDRLGSNTGSSDQGKYYPYGEDRGSPLGNDQVKFATYTRDSATGLDYADQRYYSNQFGRFMTPDPYLPSAAPMDPASWNRYAYTRGDPVNRRDPFGLDDFLDAPPDFGPDGPGGACFLDAWGLCWWEPFPDPGPVGPIDAFLANATDERKKRKDEIEQALAAIAAKVIKDATANLPVWPAAIQLNDMCWETDTLTGAYKLDVTYQVFSELGTPMFGSQLDGFSITEFFPSQEGNLGDLNNPQNLGKWQRSDNTLRGNGTFIDYLSSYSTPTLQRSGRALQQFTATGWFGTQPLDILFGVSSWSGVNVNVYGPKNVTVNDVEASHQCR